jgi:gamma-glutamylcyclotransferase (GGCT)/AIG2-like uncharacterized protein YtfP
MMRWTSRERSSVWVYGTLRRGMGNHALLAGCECLGRAVTVDRFRLFHFGCPAIAPDSRLGRQITGEVYLCPPHVLAAVRRLEGAYNTDRGPVVLAETGQWLMAEYYTMTVERLWGTMEVDHGDWVQWYHAMNR